MSDIITFEASVFTRTVSYKNFRGQTKEVELQFALDPLALMEIIASFQPKKSKSANPSKRGQAEPITDEDQLKFVRMLAVKAAGFASEDGESWEKFTDFEDSLAGQAFLTKLVSSDADRKEFSEKVVLEPFRAFVGYAKADPSNDQKEVQQFDLMLGQVENIFKTAPAPEETLEERKERLRRELESIDSDAS
jgi:hypothetical protein